MRAAMAGSPRYVAMVSHTYMPVLQRIMLQMRKHWNCQMVAVLHGLTRVRDKKT